MIRQRGFTLLEISIAMIIMVAIAAITTRSAYLKLDTRYTEHTAAEVWVIGEYAQKYIQENDEWPDQTASGCVNAITTMITDLGLPAGTIPAQSPWGNDYETSCNASSFSITTQLDDNWAPALTNMLAVTRILPGTNDTTITTLPLPGSIAALSDVLKRVDTGNSDDNTMETDLNMGNFDIDSVGTINVQRLDADTVDVGTMEADLVQAGVQVNVMSNYIGDPAFALNAYGKDDTPSTVQRGEPRTKDGSIYVNDMYMRSIGGYISSRLPNMVEKTTYTALGGDLVPKPSCPIEEPPPGLVAGAHSSDPIPKIRVRPASDDNIAIDYGVIDDVEYWQVMGSTVAKAEVYCYYPPLVDPGYEEVIQDTTPPSAPINFALTNTNNAGTANFSVTPNMELDLSHYLLRKVSGVDGNTNLSFEDPNVIQVSALIENNPYTYHLIAVDHAGNESDPSNLVTFTMQHPPAAPTNLRIIAQSNSFMISIQINPNSEPDLAGYQLYHTNGAAMGGVQSDHTDLKFSGIEFGKTYYIYARAVDNAGNESPQSNQVSFNITSPI